VRNADFAAGRPLDSGQTTLDAYLNGTVGFVDPAHKVAIAVTDVLHGLSSFPYMFWGILGRYVFLLAYRLFLWYDKNIALQTGAWGYPLHNFIVHTAKKNTRRLSKLSKGLSKLSKVAKRAMRPFAKSILLLVLNLNTNPLKFVHQLVQLFSAQFRHTHKIVTTERSEVTDDIYSITHEHFAQVFGWV